MFKLYGFRFDFLGLRVRVFKFEIFGFKFMVNIFMFEIFRVFGFNFCDWG